ncbi:amino acid adenylation domain-containing protein [Candidatus Nitrospira bockiana]
MRTQKDVESIYYLSPLQEGLLFHHVSDADADAYFYQYGFLLEGDLHLPAFEQAWQQTVDRHAVLRTAFVWERVEKPLQVVRRNATLPLHCHDWRGYPEGERKAALESLLAADRRAGFDFLQPPLMRLTLIRVADDAWYFIISHHHILLDGWSFAVILKEVMASYEAFVQGRSRALPPPTPYRHYIAWLKRQDLAAAERFWRAALAGFTAPTVLPLEPPQDPPGNGSTLYAEQGIRLSKGETEALLAFAQRHHLTLNTVVQGAWAMLLRRYSGEREVLFGATVSGRPTDLPGAETMVGLFINTLPIRVRVRGEETVSSWLRALQQQNSDLRQYEWAPLTCLQRWSEIPSGQPLFDTLVVLENYPEDDAPEARPGRLTVSLLAPPAEGTPTPTAGRNNYPLSLIVEPSAELRMILCYARRRFEHGAVARMLGHYRALIEAIAARPEARVSELSLLTEDERRQVLIAWNTPRSASSELSTQHSALRTAPDASESVSSALSTQHSALRTAPDAFELAPSELSTQHSALSTEQSLCVHQLVDAQARMHPDAVAVVYEGETLSYRELDARATGLARHLRRLGVGLEVRVGLCVERSLEMIVGLLAVLKAGGAYVPLDPKLPTERLTDMLADSGARVVLTQSKWEHALERAAVVRVVLDRGWDVIVRDASEVTAPEVQPANLAYVVYTSGSTGRPKGVAVEHRQLTNYVQGVLERLGLPAGASFATVSTIAADLGNTAIFGALCSGRPLHVLAADRGFDPDGMAEYMHDHSVDVLKIVPSHLAGLLEAGRPERVLPRRCLVLGGEATPPELLAKVRALAPACAIVNHYGPTETTVGVLTHRLSEDGESGRMPIGRPLANTYAYVLDEDLQPVPVGVPGELYLGGSGVARGYLQRPDLTAERFLPDPFGLHSGGRVYRTGDRVRYRPDGGIEFLGRVDHQVKVRGYRIELGEIEAHLRGEPAVRDAVVVLREGPDGTRRLVAYVVPNEDAVLDGARLRDRLSHRLPDYMIPSAVMVLQALPLTPNGKLDRGALPDSEQAGGAEPREYTAPRNAIEATLAGIWAEVLRLERVGVHDNFFAIGGDSIRSLQVIARANQRGLKLTPKQLFEHQTIAEAARVAVPRESNGRTDHREPEGPSPSRDTEPAAPPRVPLVALDQIDLGALGVDGNDMEDLYPLSPMQEGMLFHTLLNPGSGIYLMQQHYRWQGALDREAFVKAWHRVIERHPILRTSFRWKDLKQPLQVVHKSVDLSSVVEELDWRGLPEAEQEARLNVVLQEELKNGFDLSKAPLMKIRLIRVADTASHIVRSFHHILTDDWCFSLLMMDCQAYYEAYVEGRELHLAPPRPYRDYIAWLQKQDLAAAEAFWRNELKGFVTPTSFGIERPAGKPAADEPAMGDAYAELSASTTERLLALAQQHQLTPNTFVQGAWALLLSRYSGERDVVFGVTVAGRPTELEGVESIVGLFINSLPLRVAVPPDATVIEWLKDLLAHNYRLRQYEYPPLIAIQRWSELPPGQALFRSLVVFENAPKDPRLGEQRGDVSITFEQDRVHTNYPITVVAYPGSELGIRLSYDRQWFEHEAVERMLGHLHRLLERMTATPEARLADFSMLRDEERQQLLVGWNETKPIFPRLSTQHSALSTDLSALGSQSYPRLFEAQVRRTPEAVAVAGPVRSLTYAALNRTANQVAHAVRAEGVGPDTIVAVLDERGVDLLGLMLGVLKAGAAYLPLDPHHPARRMEQVLRVSRAALLLTTEACLPTAARAVQSMPEGSAPWILCLERDVIDRWPDGDLQIAVAPQQLAYVIYTSGSTGVPKGAMVEHRGMLNNVWSKIPILGLSEADVVAQTASQCFDISVWQFLTALLCGGRVRIVPDEIVRDPGRLLDEVEAQDITVLEIVPSLMAAILQGPLSSIPSRLRWVLPTGEALSPELCRQWFARYPRIPLMNAYGPAECSDDVALCPIVEPPVSGAVHMPIGRPIPNLRLYVLNGAMEPVPVGVSGELCVGGVGVGRGYLNEPARTAEAFVPDPFGPDRGARLYKTGDVARYRADGTLEFLGRVDHQVKIRGFRIELGEIEARLCEHPGVREAVVLAREDRPGDKRLVAYVAASASQQPGLDSEELRAFLASELPDYMVPSAFVSLAALPLTSNGKVDRRALPAPEDEAQHHRRVAPRTPTEEILAGIWTDVLGRPGVGAHDHFFELGGHSLLATQVISRIRAAFQVELPLRSLFEHPTIAALAQAVETERAQRPGGPAPRLAPRKRQGNAPLSFAQQRLWFLAQLEPDGWSYNLPFALRIGGTLDVGALERSFTELIRRHEVLRTTFVAVDGEPVQVVAPEPLETVRLPVEDLGTLPEAEREPAVRRLAVQETQRPFHLDREGPLRVRLLHLGEREHVLLMVVHHIAADAWSLTVLAQEMSVLYAAFVAGRPSPLRPLSIQYADFAQWQRDWLQGEVLEAEVAYWKHRLGPTPPVLELPADRPRPAVQTYRGGRCAFTVPASVAGQLQALSRRHGVTVFMTLLAAFKVLLHKYTGREDILVGTDVANRNRAETEDLIGFFVNLVALRTDVSGNPTVAELLSRVRETALGAYAHQDLPFEKVVEAVRPRRDLSRNPLVQVLFVLQNVPASGVELPGLEVTPLELESEVSRFDLGLFMEETDEGLAGVWKYNRDLFEPSTLSTMSGRFVALLHRFVESPDARLDALDMLTEPEREARTMEDRQHEEAKLKKLKSIKRKVVTLAERPLVTRDSLSPGQSLPLVIQPAVEDVDVVAWASGNRDLIEAELLKHGAILFRGFEVKTVSEFERLAQAICRDLFGEYGDLPREQAGEKTYGSTPYPPDRAILFHNESSHMHRWPLKQWFFCLQASPVGGATPIVDCRTMYRRLSPATRERFERKQLLYVRNFTPGFDVSWQDFFQTTEKAVVEERCQRAGMDFAWLDNGRFRTRQLCPAVAKHPKTGESVFFNQIQLHHVACLEPTVRESLLAMLGEEWLPRNVCYGDGSRIDDAVVAELSELYEQAAVRFAWQPGDVLMVDNMLVAHGRDPFVGPRKIVVAMGEMLAQQDLQTATA